MVEDPALRGLSSVLPSWRNRLELLIIQPTPFCNLDCSYCYLPDRANKRVMDLGTVEAIAEKVFNSGLPSPALSVVWHAGEPLVVARNWYEEAFAIIGKQVSEEVAVTQHFQTNGVLIDGRWCDFIRDHSVRVGVSIDGPAWLHDRHRKTRDGHGTHARVMKGIEQLRSHGIPFHVICVLTRESLDSPDALFDFFVELGCTQLCFNIEEIEAENGGSSLDHPTTEAAFRRFFERILERLRHTPQRFRVREVDSVLGALRHPDFGHLDGNSQNQPGRLLTFAWDGTFTTFSPELLGQRHPRFGKLILGNVLHDEFLPDPEHETFAQWSAEIEEGIQKCRAECKYFDFCLGGVPANKLGERATFACTETMFCRLTQKALTDCVLLAVEQDLSGRDRPLHAPTCR